MKKATVATLSFVLTIILLLTACSVNFVDKHLDNSYSNESYIDTTFEQDYTEDVASYSNVSNKILERTLELSDSKVSNFNESVSNISVKYEKMNNKDIEKCLDAYYSLKKMQAPVSNEIITNKKVDYNTLLKVVKKNNKANKDSYYSLMPNDVIDKVVKYITETVNYQISVNPYINLNILDHRLKNLKVMYYDDFGYALYNQDDLAMGIQESIDLSDSEFKQIISHEANHMVQNATIKKSDSIEMNFGVCYQFKDIEINYLYWLWYVEGVAQGNTLTQHTTKLQDSFIYDSFVSSLQCLNSTMLFATDRVYDLYYVTAQNDLDGFFKLFNCDTQEDKIEIIKMMVAINLIKDSYDDIFSDIFNKKNETEYKTDFTKHITGAYGQTQAKIFYKNLANKIKSTKVTLGDVFYLISMFESQLYRELWYNSTERMNAKDFYKNYEFIQDEFFKMMAENMELTKEELKKYYVDFFHTNDHLKYKSEMLTEEQDRFYKNSYKEFLQKPDATVSEATNKYFKSKK